MVSSLKSNINDIMMDPDDFYKQISVRNTCSCIYMNVRLI